MFHVKEKYGNTLIFVQRHNIMNLVKNTMFNMDNMPVHITYTLYCFPYIFSI